MHKSAFFRILALVIFLCVGSHSRFSEASPVPMASFMPKIGSFNVRVVLFQLKGNGYPEKVKTGSLPIAKNIIQTLSSLGYKYQPNGPVDLMIEARVGAISLKALAHKASQQLVWDDASAYGPSFRKYPVVVNKWSPMIEKTKTGPNTCYLVVELLIEENRGQSEPVIYAGSPDPIEVPYELGCPFAKCGQGVNQGLTNFLQKRFSLTGK